MEAPGKFRVDSYKVKFALTPMFPRNEGRLRWQMNSLMWKSQALTLPLYNQGESNFRSRVPDFIDEAQWSLPQDGPPKLHVSHVRRLLSRLIVHVFLPWP